MKYKEQLEQLLSDCSVTATAYVDAVSLHGQYNSHASNLQKEWERAETSYRCCLDLIKSNLVSPDDAVAGIYSFEDGDEQKIGTAVSLYSKYHIAETV